MFQQVYEAFRTVCSRTEFVRLAGAHHPLSGALAANAGFDALWASSLEISALQCVPDAEILTMSHRLDVAADIQRAVDVPVVADCDTGYGGPFNVAFMVQEFERRGITAVCMEDKVSPKLNSFVGDSHTLLSASDFAKKVEVAKSAQASPDFYVIARTEALISDLDVAEAVRRCKIYTDAGADAVLVHSRATENSQILGFLSAWDARAPVFIVPTTYPDWHVADMARAGVAGVIYANYGVRATVKTLRAVYQEIWEAGTARSVDSDVASLAEVFDLQRLEAWQDLIADGEPRQ